MREYKHLNRCQKARWPFNAIPALFILLIFALLTPSASQAQVYRRIVSLYSAHTENLVSLGAEEQLVGISKADNYPERILVKPRFSTHDDLERFLVAKPDLVLVRPMIERSYPQLMNKLKEAGIAIISLQPNSVDEIFSYWRTLGQISGHEQEAEKMIADFSARLKAINQATADITAENRPRVYFESIHSKMKTFARDSIAIFALTQAGGTNIATDATQVRTTNIASYSKERILAHASEIDIFLAQKGRMNPISIDTLYRETGFSAIKAIRENRVFLIDEHLISRPTLRLIQGIEQLHQLFYQQKAQEGVQG